MRKYRIEAKNIQVCVENGVNTCCSFKEILEVVQMPEPVDLLELFKDVKLILDYVESQEHLKDHVPAIQRASDYESHYMGDNVQEGEVLLPLTWV